MANDETVGGRIRRLRTEQGPSQGDLAKRAQLPARSYISRVECGTRNAAPEVLHRIAIALRTTDSYLISGKDTPDPALPAQTNGGFRVRGRPKGRRTIQVYPATADAIHFMARSNGLTAPELMQQIMDFCTSRME